MDDFIKNTHAVSQSQTKDLNLQSPSLFYFLMSCLVWFPVLLCPLNFTPNVNDLPKVVQLK